MTKKIKSLEIERKKIENFIQEAKGEEGKNHEKKFDKQGFAVYITRL